MKIRSMFAGAAVLAAVSLAPTRASAQGAPPCFLNTYSAILGLGGSLQGCFQFTLTELGENAGGVADQFYWNGNFVAATGSPNNAPSPAGTLFFNDDCNSTGAVTGPGTTFQFCDGLPGHGAVKTTGTITNLLGELVLGLNITQDNLPAGGNNGNPYWIYSGNPLRNAFPTPAGFQAVLMQLTSGGASAANPGGPGNAIDGEFLFAWEDLNSGCTTENIPQSFFRIEDIGNAVALDDGALHQCVTFNPNAGPGNANSDNDFNDSYIRLHIVGTRLDTVTPEPMTMTLMATGLVGLAGAQIRRRKNRK